MLTWLHGQIPGRWQPCSLLTKKQEYSVTICTVHVHDFFAAKLDWNLPNLVRMCWIPEKSTRRMSGRCFCHYFCMLSHLQIGLGMTLVEGYVHGAQTLVANESSRTPWTSRDWICGDIARKKATRPTIHTASHYSKKFQRKRERTVGER